MPPIRSISRASTVAKIGRPMKKLTMAVPLDGDVADRRRSGIPAWPRFTPFGPACLGFASVGSFSPVAAGLGPGTRDASAVPARS